MGVDGITFLNGTRCVKNVSQTISNASKSMPRQSEAARRYWMDQPVKGPDGMRAANGKLFVAENGSGRISAITVNGDKASVAAVEPAGDTL